MSFLPYISNRLFMAINRKAYKSFLKACNDPEAIQEKILNGILTKNCESQYGKKHHFSEITDSLDFQRKVPVSDYDNYLDAIYRAAQGEEQVLCSEKIEYFALSSGTTAASKLIPYTRSLKAEFRRAINPWIYDLLNSYPRIQGGKQFWIITPVTLPYDLPESTIPIGFEEDSEYFGKLGRVLIRSVMCLPDKISRIQNSENYFHIISWFLLKEGDLRLISVWNPSILLRIIEYITEYFDVLCEDIYTGSIKLPRPENTDDLKLARSFSVKDVKRGRLLGKTGPPNAGNIARIWPKLELISCWKNAWAAELIPQVQQIFANTKIQGKGLLLTEGIISIPIRKLKYPLLSINAQFYEFRNLDDKQIYLTQDLVINEDYEVIISGSGGFYRYETGDIIRVKDFYRNTPMIEFISKKNVISDICGEKLHENYVSGILPNLVQKYLPGSRYMFLAPGRSSRRWYYTLFLELSEEEKQPPKKLLAEELDNKLKLNFHYKHCRRMNQLATPHIHFLNACTAALSQRVRQGQEISSTKKLNYLETKLMNPAQF